MVWEIVVKMYYCKAESSSERWNVLGTCGMCDHSEASKQQSSIPKTLSDSGSLYCAALEDIIKLMGALVCIYATLWKNSEKTYEGLFVSWLQTAGNL